MRFAAFTYTDMCAYICTYFKKKQWMKKPKTDKNCNLKRRAEIEVRFFFFMCDFATICKCATESKNKHLKITSFKIENKLKRMGLLGSSR